MAGRVTVIWSPIEGMGRTTVGAHVANQLVENGAITLLVDLNRYASALPYVFQNFSEKSIKSACNSVGSEDILKNCTEVKGKKGLFLLNLSSSDKVDALFRFSSERVERMLSTCQEYVDHLLILMPSNYIETGFVAALSMDAENMVIVMDEDLASWHRLKLYDNYFKELGVHIPRSLVVINKSVAMLDPAIFKQFKIELMSEHVNLPYLEDVRRFRNEGRLVGSMPLQKKEEKHFCKGVMTITSFVTSKTERSV